MPWKQIDWSMGESLAIFFKCVVMGEMEITIMCLIAVFEWCYLCNCFVSMLLFCGQCVLPCILWLIHDVTMTNAWVCTCCLLQVHSIPMFAKLVTCVSFGCHFMPCVTHTWHVMNQMKPLYGFIFPIWPVLKHGSRSLMCVHAYKFQPEAKWKWWSGHLHRLPIKHMCLIWVWACSLGPERWWTMLGNGQFRGNSDGGL